MGKSSNYSHNKKRLQKTKKRKRVPERSEENKQKENESYTCGECSRCIYKHLARIGCTKCGINHHIRCAGFNNSKAAKNAEETYECKKCTKIKKGNEKTNKINNNSTAKEEEGEIEWLVNKRGKGNEV